MILHVLSQAITVTLDRPDINFDTTKIISTDFSASWSTVISEDAMGHAVTICDNFLKKKFLPMPDEVCICLQVVDHSRLSAHPKTLTRLLTDINTTMTASNVCHKRLVPPKPLCASSPDRKSPNIQWTGQEYLWKL